MNGNRGQYSSSALYNLKKKRTAANPQGTGDETAPEPRRYRALSLILSVVLPALFLMALLIPDNMLRWFFLISAGLAILAMWALRAFVKSARGTLTVIYLALAVVVGLALFMNSQTPESRAAVSRASQGSLYGNQENGNGAVPVSTEPAETGETETETEEAPISAAQERLHAFMTAWGTGHIPEMLTYCLPSWVNQQTSPKTTLWQMLQNSHPESYQDEGIEGGEGDTSRTVTMRVRFSENNGANTLKRLQVLMIKVNGVWYVDPNTLGGVIIDEAAEAARANQPIISTTIAPTSTPSPNGGSGITVYYNADGGKYYHAVPNCAAVDERYWPLTDFSFDLINSQQYKALVRCPRCNPPERPSVQ